MRGLNTRLGLRPLFIGGVAALLLTSSMLLAGWLLGDRARSMNGDLEAKGISITRTLAAQAEYGVLVADEVGLQGLIEGIAHDEDIAWVQIVDTTGEILARGPAGRPPPMGWDDAQWPKKKETTLAPRGPQDLRAISSPVLVDPGHSTGDPLLMDTAAQGRPSKRHEVVGAVRVFLDPARMDRELRGAAKGGLGVMLGVSILGILLTLPLSKWLLGPIQQLADASRHIADGDWQVQLPTGGSPEIIDLGLSFREMIASLQERDTRLAASATSLAEKADALARHGETLEGLNQALAQRNQALLESETRLKGTNADLQEANRLKSAFLASMSHELRTPLNSIIGYSQCLLDGLDGPITEDQQDSLERVERNGRHLLGLINDILDLSKIEAGRFQLKREPVDLAPLIEECVGMMRPMAQSKSLELKVEIAQDLPPLIGDSERLKQVLINLLSNGVKFTASGQVGVRVDPDPLGVNVTVWDTGPGIPKDQQETIFEAFRQLEGPNIPGTGLGLAISRRLVEGQGGTLHVESTPDEGCRFIVWLPRATSAPGADLI